MLQKYKDKREEGFTIIEVLIVLAIAGLIILIVFLAVPALQRNSRNTQRTNDASLIAAAINECINNRNGEIDECNDWTDEIEDFVDQGRLSQLTAEPVPSSTLPGAGELDVAHWAFGQRCNDAGSDVDTSVTASARDFVVLYNFETTGGGETGRCVTA